MREPPIATLKTALANLRCRKCHGCQNTFGGLTVGTVMERSVTLR